MAEELNDDALKHMFRDSGALLNGHFELRSGLHSNQYFQCALVLQNPRRAELLCRALASKLKRRLNNLTSVETVIAPALGGLLVGHELARALDRRFIFAEKQDGHLVLRRGFRIEPGERVVIAEDVITRGGRVDETIAIVRACAAQVVAVAVLVDRSSGSTDFGVPAVSLLRLAPTTWAPQECPLCREGIPLDHPGS